MDPQATWRMLIDAYCDRDWEQAEELAEALVNWMNHGGFPPETMDRRMDADWNCMVSRAVCEWVLDRARRATDEHRV